MEDINLPSLKFVQVIFARLQLHLSGFALLALQKSSSKVFTLKREIKVFPDKTAFEPRPQDCQKRTLRAFIESSCGRFLSTTRLSGGVKPPYTVLSANWRKFLSLKFSYLQCNKDIRISSSAISVLRSNNHLNLNLFTFDIRHFQIFLFSRKLLLGVCL